MSPQLLPGDSNAPVYFDANPLSDHHLTGIGRYTARLALAMAAHRPLRFFFPNSHEVIVPPDKISWSPDQDLGTWARALMQGGRAPLGTPPKGSVCVYCLLRPEERMFDHEVSVLHDLTPGLLPHTHAESTRGMFNGFWAKTLPSSDIALCVSHSTAADASWLSAIDPNRLVVAHSGPSLCVGKHGHPRKVKKRPEIGLVVSTIEPRKNPEFLFKWFHESTALPDNAELWWVGALGWILSKEDMKRFQKSSRRKIRFLGKVSDARLCKLYQQAGWSIYPSLYEGFGFPVLDSLRHGTPVLTSMNSSLREFAHKGVYFLDPYDASTVDDAWRQLQANGPGVVEREELERLYSWDNVARTLLKSVEPKPAAEEDPAASAAA